MKERKYTMCKERNCLATTWEYGCSTGREICLARSWL